MDAIKKYIIAGTVYMTITGILMHFLYDLTGKNQIIGFIAPISESTWEHIKLLFFPGLFWVLYTYYRLKHIYRGILSPLLLGLITGCISIPVLFYSYSGILGFHMFVLDILTFFAAIVLMFWIICHTLSSSTLPKHENALIFAVILLLAAFLTFTYFPPNLGIFKPPVA